MAQETGTETVAERARANDAFRREVCAATIAGGSSLEQSRIRQTMYFVRARDDDDTYFTEILKAVSVYNSFAPDTDPSGEHRTGVIEHDDHSVAFAIITDDEGNKLLALGFAHEMRTAGYF